MSFFLFIFLFVADPTVSEQARPLVRTAELPPWFTQRAISPITIISYPVVIYQNQPNQNRRQREESEAKKAEELNKNVVLSFMQACFGDKDLTAIEKYIGQNYTQHNPTVQDGKHSFHTAARGWFEGAPKESLDIRRVAADGDLVWVHWKSGEDKEAEAVVDIFRLEKGLIVEHWDVIQRVPERSLNDNTMF